MLAQNRFYSPTKLTSHPRELTSACQSWLYNMCVQISLTEYYFVLEHKMHFYHRQYFWSGCRKIINI
jgi:hypothetical protein